jgi:3-(3-hydroxy-phenyl)propionate hydroxylase
MVAREGAAPPGWMAVQDRDGLVRQRYDGRAGTAYLIRPDRYVAARWRRPNGRELAAALRRATGHG